MRGYRGNLVIATHILAQAGRMANVAERPLGGFVLAVVRAYLRSKETRLGDIVLFCDAVGKANFISLLDELTAREALGVLCRVDPRNAERARADPAWGRSRLAAMLTREVVSTPPGAPKCGPSLRSRTKSCATRSVIGETDAFSARRREKTGAMNAAD
jgi:hypothetical protein